MNSNEPTIHIRIRDLRRQRSLTQEDLAEALGLSRQSINAMEAGRCLPSLPVALQLASYFEVPLQVIFRARADEDEQADENPNAFQAYQPNPRKESPMATLVPWSPLREMRAMLDEMMDETSWPTVPTIAAPAVNVSQTPNELHIDLRAPGFKKDDLSIEVGEEFVTISGEVKQDDEQQDKERQFYRREFIKQNFSRTIGLPTKVQTDKADAEMKHGVLRITLPKQVEEKPKTAKVQIKAGE